MPAANDVEFGPWNPGLQSHIPLELRHLTTLFRPENTFTSFTAARELHSLTGLPLAELAVFRPERLLLHELMICVMGDLSVPAGSRMGDLGINFREMTNRLFEKHFKARLPEIVREYESVKQQIAERIQSAFRPTQRDWGPVEVTQFEKRAAGASDPLERVSYKNLARVMSALFTTHGRPWGTADLVCSVATNLATNAHASDVIGRQLEPLVREAGSAEGFSVLPRQEHPFIISTKGPSASGKSSLRPLQAKLVGKLGMQWKDFALISPDIFRKQLLDYSSLGPAYKYAGAFTSEEVQIIDRKLDRHMARKNRRGEMAHLLVDRFRFDSFAPDSAEAGSNLLTRFGASAYLFFVITPPEQLVVRAWKRGLEFGRYKAVDDTLAHSVEAYTGMPTVFFTWIKRNDKRIHVEILDNSIALGVLPKTVAFGDNDTLTVLDINKLLDIERFSRVNVDAQQPEQLYRDPAVLAPAMNLGFLRRCLRSFKKINFAEQATGQIYLQVQGESVATDEPLMRRVLLDPDINAALRAAVPAAFAGKSAVINAPVFASRLDQPTLGQWGSLAPPSKPAR